MIYTTNALESLHRSLRKIIKTRGSFPQRRGGDEASVPGGSATPASTGEDPLSGPPRWGSLRSCSKIAFRPQRAESGKRNAHGAAYTDNRTGPALRLRQGALPGRGEEQAAHRLAAGVLESADRRPLRDGMTGEQPARRWRDGGAGGVPTRISPVRSVSRDKSTPGPSAISSKRQIQAASRPSKPRRWGCSDFP